MPILPGVASEDAAAPKALSLLEQAKSLAADGKNIFRVNATSIPLKEIGSIQKKLAISMFF